MTSVTQWMIGTIEQMPDAFPEKAQSLQFLKDDFSTPAQTLSMARELLRTIADACHCLKTWQSLIDNHLVASEQAYRILLPEHRDHVLHSAHLYLLGLCIYWTIIRQDAVLGACIADTHYRDAQAFYSPASRLYSCHAKLIESYSLADERKRLASDLRPNAGKGQYARVIWEMIGAFPCDCDATIAGDMCNVHELLNNIESKWAKCCGPSKDYVPALRSIANAIAETKLLRAPFGAYVPNGVNELDQIFRRRWGLAALMHDAAYPLELAAKEIKSYWDAALFSQETRMACCENPFSFSLNHCCDLLTVPRLQSLCSSVIDQNMYSDNIATMIAANICNKLHPSFSPATLAEMMIGWLKSSLHSGTVDHGVFSAALFLRAINSELRSNKAPAYGIVTSDHKSDAVEFFYIECVDAAAAMYLHNTKRYLGLFKASKLEYVEHPIAWMLFLCDQLQEWLRPSGENNDPEQLLAQAQRCRLTVADGTIFYDFPPDANPVGIKEGIGEHLAMFGENILKRAT